MNPPGPPNVYAVDPGHPLPPEELPSPDGGEVIAVVVEEASRTRGWPARLAAGLAARWSEEHPGLVLADGDLSSASLHESLGASNGEGLTDFLLYGASRKRITRAIADGRHLFISSGTVVADPESAFRDARWSTLITETKQAGMILMLYLPADSDGAAALADGADRVIRLTAKPPEENEDARVTFIFSAGDSVAIDEVAMPDSDGLEGVGASPAPGRAKGPSLVSLLLGPFVLATLLLLLVILVLLALLGYFDIPGITSATWPLPEEGVDPFALLAGLAG